MEDERAERIHAIVYSCDSREELAQRIVRLEDEGANLRNLATLLKTCNHYAMLCEHCPFQGELDSLGNFTCHIREKSNQLSKTFGIGEL